MTGALRRVTANDLPLWVVYDHPTDYPDQFVARLWSLLGGATGTVLTADTLDQLRGDLQHATDFVLCRLERNRGDDPCILETWV